MGIMELVVRCPDGLRWGSERVDGSWSSKYFFARGLSFRRPSLSLPGSWFLLRLLVVPAPDLGQVFTHVDPFAAHLHHPRVVKHPPWTCPSEGILFQAFEQIS